MFVAIQLGDFSAKSLQKMYLIRVFKAEHGIPTRRSGMFSLFI
jgi:hypothetical protein